MVIGILIESDRIAQPGNPELIEALNGYNCIMKSLFQLTTAVLFLIPLSSFSQSAGIDAALNKGSASDVGVFFAPKLDISMPGTEATLTSAEAVRTLTAFFDQNTVKGYNRAHLTAPQNGRAAYSLGDLYTANGTYRVYLYYNNDKMISEVRIQK